MGKPFPRPGLQAQCLADAKLAETKPRWECGADSAFLLQARLLGTSGLLPEELTRSQKSSDTFLRGVWDARWHHRDEFADCRLPRRTWKFHGLRPANPPQRRLGLASHWLADRNLLAKIESWGATGIPDKKLPASLHELVQVKRDEFGSWHCTFKSAPLPRPLPLLGAENADGLRTAAAQQSLLQIVRDFCDHSNAACEHCRFPERVRVWKAGLPT